MELENPYDAPLCAKIDFDSLIEFVGWNENINPKVIRTQLPTSGFVFRGVSKSDTYKLVPSALRPGDERPYNKGLPQILKYHPAHTPIANPTNKDVAESEFALLMEFYKEANRQGLDVPNTDAISRYYLSRYYDPYLDQLDSWYDPQIVELASVAQHNGLPTRLLDWTFDVNVAFYFALKGVVEKWQESENKLPDNERYAIWCVNADYLISVYSDICQLKCPVRFFVPKYSQNKNAGAQEGMLSYHLVEGLQSKYDEKPLDCILKDYLREISTKQINTSNDGIILLKMTFPTENAIQEFKYLNEKGYNAARLFPGYSGVKEKLQEDEWIRKLSSRRHYN